MRLSFGQEIFQKSKQNLFHPNKTRLFGIIQYNFRFGKTYFVA
jgi:hypothetical protein